uniref:UDP-N-acetylmuramoyl-L-alanyl-D-glutamate--2,6-diaminopimelate ligase n=1 Tax=Acinetobacter larvae TaxID=1789224 RepID=A0A1B2M2P9_9GAMM|nr:UDP-N-acetylmuramoyl-L-alanyl-D-glutamate--2,6-diaminopimelate ligase [Acinetobacter larvae]AOA59449.1 UDP-N-acetylmuramoyl-L-alanyl-D-glutamate--2,6-diaminopimelate ligase [Acinetobacter larvae]
MCISFQDIHPVNDPLDWMTEAFQGFSLDSRQVKAGQIFIARNSYHLSAAEQVEKIQQYAADALAQGALGVISQIDAGLEQAWVCPDVNAQIGLWQQAYLTGSTGLAPLPVLAVTGTNGKTTIVRLIAEFISLKAQRCAVFGTTGNGILPSLEASSHTTLDPVQLQNLMFKFAQQGAQYAALEASSHGLQQGRLNGCDIKIAAYSNLSRDHLDYHGSLDAYADAKAKLFQFSRLEVAVINRDDPYAAVMLQAASNNPAHPKVLTYSTRQGADYQVFAIQYAIDGVHFHLKTKQAEYAVHSPLLGHFNIENLLASLIVVEQLGFDLAELIDLVPQLQGAPGRMQVLRDGERLFVVDYAHTPDALTQVLATLKRHVKHRLWAVFGCGGDRDRGKRPLMTQAALALADQVLLTSDNPRSEDPAQIFADMKHGLDLEIQHIQQIPDRREAISYVLNHAEAGDIVVIAGKGHENYQEVNGVRHWFDDVVEVRAAIQAQHSHPTAYPAN